MSQHLYPSSNHRLSYTINGHSPTPHSMPGYSGLDGRPRPTDVDPLNLHSFDNASDVTSGFLGGIDIAALTSGRIATGLADDRSRYAGLENARLINFYYDRDEPWNQVKSRVGGHPEAVPSSFTNFRETAAPSECETSVGPGTLQSDSGYGSQARQSVGIPSVYGDVDRNSEVLLNMAELKIPNGPSHVVAQVHDISHPRNPRNQGALGRLAGVPTNNTPSYACPHCQIIFNNPSDHKKHIARHEKPHKCPESGCSKATDGFAIANDLQRHLRTVHGKAGVRYRCFHEACVRKAKDWPRADNFRSHLKKVHNIILHADDNHDAYILRSPNTEVPSNDGVAAEVIAPSDHESSDPPSWPRLEQDNSVQMSGLGGASEALPLDRPDFSLPPTDARILDPTGHELQDVSNPQEFWGSRAAAETQDVDHRKSPEIDTVLPGAYHGHDGGEEIPREAARNVLSGESLQYVQPNDLCTRTLDPPASLDEDSEPEAIALDDGYADYQGTYGDDTDTSQNDCAVKTPRSPPTSSQTRYAHDDIERSLGQDGAKQPKGAGTDGHSENISSGLAEVIKPGTPSFPDQQASASSSEDLDEDVFQELIEKAEKADKRRLDKLLRSRGYYVKPKGSQARATKPAEQSAAPQLAVPCSEPGCRKSFNRRCEMKKHLKRHNKPYACTRCPKRFGSKNDWKRHENSQHYQHEIWKCDEKLKTPLGETCKKVCNRRETFRQHLASHHAVEGLKLEDKLDKCRIGRLGEARFWCGFCRDIIEIEQPQQPGHGPDACNARYNHIDDHYSGRNGAVRREASEWQYLDSDQPEPDLKDPPPAPPPPPPRADERKDGSGGAGESSSPPSSSSSSLETKTATPAPAAQASELKKRSKHGAGPTAKRARISARQNWMWYCCQCNNAWSLATVVSCISCLSPSHARCADCRVEEVELKDDVQVTM